MCRERLGRLTLWDNLIQIILIIHPASVGWIFYGGIARDWIVGRDDLGELHLFVRNWNWSGKAKPLLKLIQSAHVDTGARLLAQSHIGGD